jgi:hypothetical protein
MALTTRFRALRWSLGGAFLQSGQDGTSLVMALGYLGALLAFGAGLIATPPASPSRVRLSHDANAPDPPRIPGWPGAFRRACRAPGASSRCCR